MNKVSDWFGQIRFSVLIVVAATGLACKSSGTEAGTDGGGGDSSDAAGVALGFTPSNLPAAGPVGTLGDAALVGNCVVDGDLGEIRCGNGRLADNVYAFKLVEQLDPDRTKVALFHVRNLTVEASAQVLVVGAFPVAIVSAKTLRINGSVSVTVDSIYRQRANGGGFAGRDAAGAGTGPGAGGGPVLAEKVGAGGGGYCGLGGPAGGAAGPGTNGGTTYGNVTLVPLQGGSSGGSNQYGIGSAGGGALQLVAGSSIDIGTTGSVSASGGGGPTLGGGGAGSGGAVLLEAPSVRVAGIIAVNGGGGGAVTLADSGLGENGRPDGVAAKGGGGPNRGGDGSSATMVDGSAGVYVEKPSGGAPDTGGAGGGGAGRIRINTSTGTADLSGTLSPSLTTPCATQGTIGA